MASESFHTTYFQDLLRERALSVTPFRVKLLKIFSESHVPLSASQLLEKFDEKVDKVTLYRNVESFEKVGLICRMYFTGQEALYEERFTDHHHHHLICTHCGKVEDVEDCDVSSPQTDSGFKTEHHHVEFYGVCKKCQQKLGV